MLQAKQGRSGKQHQEQNSPNLGTAFWSSPVNSTNLYTVIHLLVVDVACVLFLTQSACMVPNQNTQNIYHKQMNNGVVGKVNKKCQMSYGVTYMCTNQTIFECYTRGAA